jgi:hypothetical protein
VEHQRRKQGGITLFAPSTHITSFFSPSRLDYDDLPHPLFRRLYLGTKPRYKPSAASALSPTPVATNRCHQIIPTHRGLFLRDWFLHQHEANFPCRIRTVQSHLSTNSSLSSRPCFRIIRRSGRDILGANGKLNCLQSVFLCTINNLKCISLTAAAFRQRQAAQYHPQPTEFAKFGSFEVWEAGGVKFVVSLTPAFVFFGGYLMKHHLPALSKVNQHPSR